ncbi:MAG: translocation/assembly module TamB domain-containing protein [Mariniphaga sp.]
MKKAIKYSLRFLGGFILVILLIVLLVSLLLQVQPVKDKIAGIAENQVSKTINGELTIGELEGNFFTDLSLKDLLLTLDNDTLAFISELNLHYNLLSLFNGTVDVHSASIDRPYIYLEQINDSTWNVQNLTEPGEEETDTTTAGTMNINLSEFTINEGHIRINSPDTIIPQHIRNLNTNLSLYYSEDRKSAEIGNFTLTTENPDLQLNQFSLDFDMNGQQAELSEFILRTAQNRITVQAQYQAEPVQKGSARLETDELRLEEFAPFLPGLTIPATPFVTLEGELEQDTVTLDLDLEDGRQTIAATVASGNLMEYLFRDTSAVLNYRLNSTFSNIVPGHWTGNQDLDYLLNGNLFVTGHGTEPSTADVSLVANLNESTIEDQRLKNISADIDLRKGNLEGVVQGDGGFGQFHLSPAIKDLMGNPSYNLTLSTRNFNLAVITGSDSLQSDINLQAQIAGNSFEPERISAGGNLLVYNSSFQDISMDTVMARIHYANENVRIDSLRMETKSITAKATGNYSMKANSDLHLTVSFEGLEEFESFIPAPELSTSGILEARVTGRPDSLDLAANLRLDSTRYDTITFENLQLLANGKIEGNDTLFDASLLVEGLDLGEFQLDSVQTDMDGSLDSVFVQAKLVNEDLNTRIHAGIAPGDKLAITIPEWIISYKNQEWYMKEPPAYVELDSVNYFIDNFTMVSGESDSAQFISLQGQVSREGKQDFTMEAGNISIARMTQTMDMEFEGSGTFDLDLNLNGTAQAPEVEGAFGIEDAEINEYSFTTLQGDMRYNNNAFDFKSLIVPRDSGRFEVTASMPLELNLDTMGFNFSPDDSLRAQVLIEEFSLGILNSFDIPVQTTGFLEGEVHVNGTANSPDPDGNIRLVNASFAMEEYGIDYNDVSLNISFLSDRIEVDTFQIETDDGHLTGTGLVNFGSEFYKGDITDSKIKLDFDGFNPVNHPQFNMEVDGYAELKGEADSVKFGGDLSIPQAEFNLPAIFSLMGRMETQEMPKPILMQELEDMPQSLDTMDIIEFEEEESDSVSFDYFDQLAGQLRVRIPRNTWIKNDDMRLEISGELEVIKNADFFELFGQVEVVRGQYELLGRTFEIEEGTVNFEGGEEMNLRMDITASYTFRNNQQVQQELTVNVTGTPEEPEVNFQLDGSSISEGDALSYIVFGKSMDELTVNEQDNMQSAGVGSVAEQAAASLLSAQLTGFLQDKLNVDYIEVKSGGGFDEASVVVGKYITNDLFVSYEQRFGQTEDQNPKKYEVKLEYELFRFLFFELNNSTIDSGFDVIFKFDVL